MIPSKAPSGVCEAPRHDETPFRAFRPAQVRLAQEEPAGAPVAVRNEERALGETLVDRGGLVGAARHAPVAVDDEERGDLRNADHLVAQPRRDGGRLRRSSLPHSVAQHQVHGLQRARGLLGEEAGEVREVAQCAALRALAIGARVPDRRADVDDDQQHAERYERAAQRDAGSGGACACGHDALSTRRADEVGHRLHDFAALHRLRQRPRRAERERVIRAATAQAEISRHRDDRNGRMVLPQAADDRAAAGSRHAHVGHDQRRLRAFDFREPRGAVGGLSHSVTRGLQPVGDEVAHDLVVVYHENVRGFPGLQSLLSCWLSLPRCLFHTAQITSNLQLPRARLHLSQTAVSRD